MGQMSGRRDSNSRVEVCISFSWLTYTRLMGVSVPLQLPQSSERSI